MPASQDPVLDQLNQLHNRCCTTRRQRLLQQRWGGHQALAGLTVTDISTVLADPDSPAHNPVSADMLRAHRARDTDATTVLLAAFRPVVCALVRSDAYKATERRAGLWAAVGKHLATTDPDQTETARRPFIITFIGRIRRDARRWRTEERRIEAQLGATPLDPEHAAGAGGAVEDAATARYYLTQIADHMRAGDISPERVHELVAHRLSPPHKQQPASSSTRARICDTSQRLAALIGYAA